MPTKARVWWRLALVCVALAVGCSSGEDPSKRGQRDTPADTDEADDPNADPLGGPPPARGPTPRAISSSGSGEDEAAKLIYLISYTNELYSFDPRVPGKAAYRFIGKLECKTMSKPQSMAVDRSGWAWVFFSPSRELFKVSVRDASCQPAMPYRHPSGHPQLGMGFTAAAPGSAEERLYMLSPDFGLATVSLKSLSVDKTNKLAGSAELTGGGDGRLFHFAAHDRQLNEIDLSSHALRPIHKFTNMNNVNAWAFARFAGKFYVFTAGGWGGGLGASKTTEYDPKRGVESVRDENIGFAVVGAGQSTLAPPPDQSGDLSGDFPNQ